MKVAKAFLSVHDKRGITGLAAALEKLRIQIISSGGTARAIKEVGVGVMPVSDYTGFPEILGGRVKTLHPAVHAGLLADMSNPAHVTDMSNWSLHPIGLLVANFYPFQVVVDSGASLTEVIEDGFDIGGPAMVRAAAKNFENVAVVVDPDDYGIMLTELQMNDGVISRELRVHLAIKALHLIARYDAQIAGYFQSQLGGGQFFGDGFALAGYKVRNLRYGENPHQLAALYATEAGGLANAVQVQGNELSHNNFLDLDAAFTCAWDFGVPTAVIVKHSNPCGVASDANTAKAFRMARACDPTSAFGGVGALNVVLDAETAEAVIETFFEAIVAPEVTEGAIEILGAKPNLRVLAAVPVSGGRAVRTISGGFLAQTADNIDLGKDELRVVTKRAPTDTELRALRFAWKVAKHVKSNAIVMTGENQVYGVGAGQMSRVDSASLAVDKALANRFNPRKVETCVVGSDAFFPFRDGLDICAAAGATAIIQPGGSVRDVEVIAAADEHDIAMVVTGVRHFKH